MTTIKLTVDAARVVFGRLPIFASALDGRPALNGVQVDIVREGEGGAFIVAAAADGFHLGVQRVPCEVSGDGSALFPSVALKRIASMLPRRFMPDEAVTIDFDDKAFSVAFTNKEGDQLSVGGALIQGTFPEYRNLIPQWTAEDAAGVIAIAPALMRNVIAAARIGQSAPILRWFYKKPHDPAICIVNHETYPPFVAVVMPMFVVGTDTEVVQESFESAIASVLVPKPESEPAKPQRARKPRRKAA